MLPEGIKVESRTFYKITTLSIWKEKLVFCVSVGLLPFESIYLEQNTEQLRLQMALWTGLFDNIDLHYYVLIKYVVIRVCFIRKNILIVETQRTFFFNYPVVLYLILKVEQFLCLLSSQFIYQHKL